MWQKVCLRCCLLLCLLLQAAGGWVQPQMGAHLLQGVADLPKSLCQDARGLQKLIGKLDHTKEDNCFKGTKFLGNILSLSVVHVS